MKSMDAAQKKVVLIRLIGIVIGSKKKAKKLIGINRKKQIIYESKSDISHARA